MARSNRFSGSTIVVIDTPTVLPVPPAVLTTNPVSGLAGFNTLTLYLVFVTDGTQRPEFRFEFPTFNPVTSSVSDYVYFASSTLSNPNVSAVPDKDVQLASTGAGTKLVVFDIPIPPAADVVKMEIEERGLPGTPGTVSSLLVRAGYN